MCSNLILTQRYHNGLFFIQFFRCAISLYNEPTEYLYKILAFAEHTETGEKLVVYQALYAPFKICARPYAMFMSEVDREKYPAIKQKYRFEVVQEF